MVTLNIKIDLVIIENQDLYSIPYDFNELKGELSHDLIDSKTKKVLLVVY